MPRKQIARVSIISEISMVVALREFVREVALGEGIDQRDAERLMLATEEAAVNVIEHALANDQNSSYDMILEREPGRFIIAFEDQGIPIDWDTVGKLENTGLGILLIRHCADKINFINLGKQGKRFEVIKEYVRSSHDNTEIEQEPLPGEELPDIAPLDTPIVFREMTSADCSLLARCMYQVYGYTYKDTVYYPEKLEELISRGLLVSVLALSPEGEIVGHQGLLKPRPDAMTAEITMGVVNPKYRGRGLFEKLKGIAFGLLKAQGLPGLFGEAVTNHPYSQKANFAMGGRPSGFMLGFVPPDRVFAAIDDNALKRDRLTVVLFHTKLNTTTSHPMYPPLHHRGIIERTYAESGIARELVTSGFHEIEKKNSNVTMRTVSESGVAYLDVIEIGENFAGMVRGMLRELCLMRFDCIYIDLPLADPLTASVCAAVEYLGFFYAGIIPDYLPSGDALRLQYLNNVAIDPDKVVVVSDFGKELFDYVIAEWHRSFRRDEPGL